MRVQAGVASDTDLVVPIAHVTQVNCVHRDALRLVVDPGS